jgi:hypothetical protein
MTAWHHIPEARALLADIVANPPRFVTRRLESWERWTRDDETVSSFDRNDDRVDALSRLSDREFGKVFDGVACRERRRRLVRSWPGVDAVILDAMGAAHRDVAA